ncbi:MAG: hypothetical protein NC920_04960 [Candidatus Omnitrophica bacterium]|nr:hypothetical protein [Candidatus Omnitrophota bacterium]MCM8798184.1 hypothetical protein [Candidatus Omnitrophota bacterium]
MKEELSYERKLRVLITEIILKTEKELLREKKLKTFNNVRKFLLIILSLGLILIFTQQSFARISETKELRQRRYLEKVLKKSLEKVVKEVKPYRE